MQYVYYVCSTDVEVTVIYYTKYCLQKNIYSWNSNKYMRKKFTGLFQYFQNHFPAFSKNYLEFFGLAKHN